MEEKCGHSAQRLDVQPQIDQRERLLKVLKDRRHRTERHHDIERQRHFGFDACMDAARPGDKIVGIVNHSPRRRQQRPACSGQPRAPRSFAVEQADAKLPLERDDPVADHRDRPAKLARRGVEAAFVVHRKEETQLVEGRLADLHCSTP